MISTSLQQWVVSLSVYAKPRIIAMLFLGFSAGLPFLLVFSTLSARLTEADLNRGIIGLFSWVGITYSIKVLWAPFVDQLRIPLLTERLGQRRAWMLVAQIGIVLGITGMALINPQTDLLWLALFAVLTAFASATQDIAIDAYRIEAVAKKYQAAMAASYILGYRIALLAAGAGALYAAEFFGWDKSYLFMVVLAGVGITTTLIISEPNPRTIMPFQFNKIWLTEAIVHPFVDFFQRNNLHFAILILLFISVYRISDITMGVMANPFYLDMGYTKIQIADITKIFGFFMTIFGSILGGILVVRFGVMAILITGAVLVAATNLLFAVLALFEPDLTLLAVVISADNMSGGLAITAFIAYLSSLTHTAYTATQYALFSSLMTLPAKFIGGFSGFVVEANGYFEFFIYAAFLGVPAILLAIYLTKRLPKDPGTE